MSILPLLINKYF